MLPAAAVAAAGSHDVQSLDPVLLNVPRTGSSCSLAMAMISPAVHRLIVAGE